MQGSVLFRFHPTSAIWKSTTDSIDLRIGSRRSVATSARGP
jgi:hypothetical protein